MPDRLGERPDHARVMEVAGCPVPGLDSRSAGAVSRQRAMA